MKTSHLLLFPLLLAIPALAQKKATPEPDLTWHDVTDWGVEGRAWVDEPRARWFDRFPAAAEKTLRGPVWSLSRDRAGMMV